MKRKKAIGYVRISTSDQSQYSLDGQAKAIQEYCDRHNYQLVKVFEDDGRSAKDFNRPEFKKLEKFLKRTYKNVDLLIVMKYDRLIRNTVAGLNFIHEIESNYDVRVLSVWENIIRNPWDPYFFKVRANMLVDSDFELRVIRDRTKFGMRRGRLSGRYLNKAPFGYENSRDPENKPMLKVIEDEAPVIQQMFNDYLEGISFKEILSRAKAKGFRLKGNSAVRRTLSNPVYAGLIKVHGYRDEPETIVDGLHDAIISQTMFWVIQEKLNAVPRSPKKMDREDLPLKGIIHCEACGHKLTAGWSTGKTKKYAYYQCYHCKNGTIRADQTHADIASIMSQLCLTDEQIEYTANKIHQYFQEGMKVKSKELFALQKDIAKLKKRLKSLHEKFILDQISLDTYRDYKTQYESELNDKEILKSQFETAGKWISDRIDKAFGLLTDLNRVYDMCNVMQKHGLIRLIFGQQLVRTKQVFRTRYLDQTFAHKSAEINGLEVVERLGFDNEWVPNPDWVPPGNVFELSAYRFADQLIRLKLI